MIAEQTILQAGQMLLLASPPGSRAVLFGSHATGMAGEHSDVDFMVVEPEVKGSCARPTGSIERCAHCDCQSI